MVSLFFLRQVGLQFVYIGSWLKLYDLVQRQLKFIQRILRNNRFDLLTARSLTDNQTPGFWLSATRQNELSTLVELVQECSVLLHKMLYGSHGSNVL